MVWFNQGGPMVVAILATDAFVIALGFLGFLLALAGRRTAWLVMPARLYALLLLLASGTPLFEGIIGYWLTLREASAAGTVASSAALWVGLASTLLCGVVSSMVVMLAALPPPNPTR